MLLAIYYGQAGVSLIPRLFTYLTNTWGMARCARQRNMWVEYKVKWHRISAFEIQSNRGRQMYKQMTIQCKWDDSDDRSWKCQRPSQWQRTGNCRSSHKQKEKVKWLEMTLDKKVGTRLKRAMNAIPRNLDGILKSDKEAILKIVSLEMMQSNLHFRWAFGAGT